MTKRTARKSRRQKPSFSKTLDSMASNLLAMADDLWKQGECLDTTVRDTLADGIARLVYVAYDCQGCNRAFGDDDSFDAFRYWSTEKWFRDRGFAEWYAKGAATLFHTLRLPSFRLIQVTRRTPRRRKKVDA